MKKVISFLIAIMGIWVPVCYIAKIQQQCINQWKEQADKNQGLFILMDQWINIKQDGKNLAQFFCENNYKRIAVHGKGYVGQRLIKELKNTEIEIVDWIDSDTDNILLDCETVTIKDDLLSIDAIVVTEPEKYDVICDGLIKKMNVSVLAIEDILNEV